MCVCVSESVHDSQEHKNPFVTNGPHLPQRRPVLRREDGNKGAKRQCDSEGILRKGEPFHTQPQLSIILQITNMRTARSRQSPTRID